MARPPVAARGPAGESEEPQPVTLVWNAWAESGAFHPTSRLAPNSRYDLLIDLAPFPYAPAGGPVHSRAISDSLNHQLDRWIDDPAEHQVPLTAVLLPDPAYFQDLAEDERARPLTVDVDRIRRVRAAGSPPLQGNAFDRMREGAPDFLFGRVRFTVTTGARKGTGLIGVSLWVADNRPVDELVLPFCIATEDDPASVCPPSPQIAGLFTGWEPVRVASENSQPPDAALHFLRLSSNGLVGVFRRRDWPAGQYQTWSLSITYAQMLAKLRDQLIPAFSQSDGDEALLRHGTGLYNVLFPDSAPQARAEFERFVVPVLSADPPPTKPPSLFVRMFRQSPDDELIVPIGLVSVPVDGAPRALGFRFRIEAPLIVQSYMADSQCISRWVFLVPPAQGVVPQELRDARERIATRLVTYTDLAKIEDSMSGFGNWVGQSAEDDATALIILSHHDRSRVFFTPGDAVSAEEVLRRFRHPSLAVLDGCGTGVAGAAGFVERLNDRGMLAIIATATEVQPEMAGDFLDCLGAAVDAHRNDATVTLWQSYFEALQCLRDRPQPAADGTYGVRALTYVLLGDGNLRLCPPAKGIQ